MVEKGQPLGVPQKERARPPKAYPDPDFVIHIKRGAMGPELFRLGAAGASVRLEVRTMSGSENRGLMVTALAASPDGKHLIMDLVPEPELDTPAPPPPPPNRFSASPDLWKGLQVAAWLLMGAVAGIIFVGFLGAQ